MGRGKCIKALSFALLIIACSSCMNAAITHVVGDSKGWSLSVSYTDWINGRSFTQGDTLVFNYAVGAHNVAPVNVVGYRRCKAPVSKISKAASTGNDKFTLKKGANYFICSFPGHCSAGMKIQVNAI